MPYRPFMYFENPIHGLIMIAVLGVILLIVILCERLIIKLEVSIMDDRRALQKVLRQQAAKIGEGKSTAEMNAIIIDVDIAVKAYRKARRKAFWAKFWEDVNNPTAPRLFF